ncbi:MAG: GFA family protein [Rhizobiaceae bacterium]|nr:MAG: GFA family protein [Rhizobiaceae bacterium]
MFTGGCACGAIRYRLRSKPYDTGWCHCRVCQRASGASGMVFTTIRLSQFVIEKGDDRIGHFATTTFGSRGYCRDCGSPLTIHDLNKSEEIDVAVGSLDEPDAFTPGFHLFASEAPAWGADC